MFLSPGPVRDAYDNLPSCPPRRVLPRGCSQEETGNAVGDDFWVLFLAHLKQATQAPPSHREHGWVIAAARASASGLGFLGWRFIVFVPSRRDETGLGGGEGGGEHDVSQERIQISMLYPSGASPCSASPSRPKPNTTTPRPFPHGNGRNLPVSKGLVVHLSPVSRLHVFRGLQGI